MTYHTMSLQLTKLFETYCVALSLRDMVAIRARLLAFARRASRFNTPSLAQEALQAVSLLERDIQRARP
ncbi:hypothetical protein ACW5WQ_21310 [Aeromonas rivuli]|uniref:hypothetical protein n=1 Tax=Aeromonas rivuli TaxID=648794 RepID=UPI0005A96BCB|nr:hypothetical protein [Aeromonas rivuli]